MFKEGWFCGYGELVVLVKFFVCVSIEVYV